MFSSSRHCAKVAYSLLFGMAVSSLFFTACREADFGVTLEKLRLKEYSSKFSETFGPIDSEHPWNTAAQVNFDVSLPVVGLYTVEVFTANPHFPNTHSFLIGKFDELEGGQHWLSCDFPAKLSMAYMNLIDEVGNQMMLPVDIIDGVGVVTVDDHQLHGVQRASDEPSTWTRASNTDPVAPPMAYIIACEDMGGDYDWDFNDVVFGIEHVSGQSQARVKLLAAGGTSPVQIYYKDQPVNFIDQSNNGHSELHDVWGESKSVPVNVGAVNGVSHDPVYSDYFTVDESFSVLSNAAEFKVKVSYYDGESVSEIHVPDLKDKSRCPQAFLVADPDWHWPVEGQEITEAYDDFAEWVGNFQENANWTNSVWGGRVEAYVPMLPSMYYEWTDASASAIKSELSSTKLLLNVVVSVEDGYEYGVVYGVSQTIINPKKFADLCSSDYLVAVVAKDFEGPDFYFVSSSATLYKVTPTNTAELNITTNDDGTKTYTIDLKKIRENLGGHSHLAAVTTQTNTKINSLQLDNYDCGVENLYFFNYLTKESSASDYWTPLEKTDYHRWSSDKVTQSTVSPYFNLIYEVQNRVFVSNGYGNDDTEHYLLDFASLKRENVMKVVIERTESDSGSPHFVFNYSSADDQLDLTEGSRYVVVTHPNADNYIYYINLKAMKRDHGHSYLHCVRTDGRGEIKLKEKIGLRQ